ncbi:MULTISPECIES: type II secretion system minor pseudopilin GspI [unclassified Oceanobacter]|uniref:type II secretion system minor pseudopilin GspI n=1 Tax=unclassified Oceanobacter TaxID=2620260 RepID=UPI002736A39C|nr:MULTISPECIES: type II secretion system minor pseudopilin GspI [unclassified Oceanobacter]MDP2608547.1 type II secretion system minor pseudopilin GspI [Oceanobacter sp. 1_MG-2023]MDP2611691.1 type II secretion system minor pseudopilin GspI [Oceanobacter sp. 2_MG-2023]
MSNNTFNACRRADGFTLLEVMIALTIFASIAIVISGTTSQAADTLLTLENKTMASWVAENRLAEIRLSHETPKVGTTRDTVDMASREWQTLTTVISTSWPGVVRVTVDVSLENEPDYILVSLATIMGEHG